MNDVYQYINKIQQEEIKKYEQSLVVQELAGSLKFCSQIYLHNSAEIPQIASYGLLADYSNVYQSTEVPGIRHQLKQVSQTLLHSAVSIQQNYFDYKISQLAKCQSNIIDLIDSNFADFSYEQIENLIDQCLSQAINQHKHLFTQNQQFIRWIQHNIKQDNYFYQNLASSEAKAPAESEPEDLLQFQVKTFEEVYILAAPEQAEDLELKIYPDFPSISAQGISSASTCLVSAYWSLDEKKVFYVRTQQIPLNQSSQKLTFLYEKLFLLQVIEREGFNTASKSSNSLIPLENVYFTKSEQMITIQSVYDRFVSLSDLQDYLFRHTLSLNSIDMLQITNEILNLYEQLYQQQATHKNIRMHNILLSYDYVKSIKTCFGVHSISQRGFMAQKIFNPDQLNVSVSSSQTQGLLNVSQSRELRGSIFFDQWLPLSQLNIALLSRRLHLDLRIIAFHPLSFCYMNAKFRKMVQSQQKIQFVTPEQEWAFFIKADLFALALILLKFIEPPDCFQEMKVPFPRKAFVTKKIQQLQIAPSAEEINKLFREFLCQFQIQDLLHAMLAGACSKADDPPTIVKDTFREAGVIKVGISPPPRTHTHLILSLSLSFF